MIDIQLEIEFHMPSDDCLPIELRDELEKRIRSAAHWVAQRFQLNSLIVSIAVVDDPTIQRLNKLHLNHDWATDVISFAFETGDDTNGEVIASWETAQRLCLEAGWTGADELTLYVCHGLLHLVGLDDIQPVDRLQMRQMEYEFLRDSGVATADQYLSRFNDVQY